jgi:hypothetical protein
MGAAPPAGDVLSFPGLSSDTAWLESVIAINLVETNPDKEKRQPFPCGKLAAVLSEIFL